MESMSLWRGGWADAVNAALENENHSVRVDHRSYERQGIDQIPTIHLGVAAFQIEKRGIRTERGDVNREISVTNNQLRQLRARINKAKKWLYSQPITDAPSLVDMMKGVANGKNLDSQWKKISNLKTQAKLLIFLQENNISDMSTFADKVTQIHQSQYDLANTIKAEERRIMKLNEHLAQVDIRKKHMAVYKKYKSLDPKKRGVYKEKHADEIGAYESALQYLKDHLNGYDKIPEKAWRAERDKLLAERYAHVDEYYKLKDDIRNVEILRCCAENLMSDIMPERIPRRGRDIEL